MEMEGGSLKSPLCADGCLESLESCSVRCLSWCFGVWFVLLSCDLPKLPGFLAWLSNSCERVGGVNLLGWDGCQGCENSLKCS